MAAKRANPSARERLTIWRHSFLRFTHHFTPAIDLGAKVLGVLTFISAVGCLLLSVTFVGFEYTPGAISRSTRLLHAFQGVFAANVIYNILLRWKATRTATRPLKWVVDIAILLSLIPLLYPHPQHPWIPVLEHVLYSRWLLCSVLCAYSAVEICYGVISALGKRTNPSLIMAVSFLILIFGGSLLLMMPKCTVEGITFVDSLFVATSAVCITGLTPVDISSTLTPTGLMILALMIQAGGLGVMTFTSFFALFFSGNTSIYSQLMVKDMIYSKTISQLIPTLLYILGVTVVIELAGAAAIFLSVHNTLGLSLHDELVFSAFHSLSAFCNAGFSNVEGGLSNPMLMGSNQSIYLIVSVLVAAGGLGFPILMNLRQAFMAKCRALRNRLHHRPPGSGAHQFDLNTKIVLCATGWIFLISTIAFFLMEYDNTMRDMSLWDKAVQSVFNSWVPRSSGFSSVPAAGMLNVTLIMFVVLMWIGGGPQSTAGGVKVNTFAAMLLNLRSIVKGRTRVVAFKRTIATGSLRRAHAVIALSIISYTVYAILLVGLEPLLSTRDLLYEAASALFTVGSSLGVTPLLSPSSKILLCTAMFLGRVGLISLLMGIVGSRTEPRARFPEDSLIIN